MGLREYLKKRHFQSTPEPRGTSKTASSRAKDSNAPDASKAHKSSEPAAHPQAKNSNEHNASEERAKPSKPTAESPTRLKFVVQEHHATALHYDFRLELDGVLKSWAVPKGPSLDPHVQHLAIQTEDHPYEYRTFEGVIPHGNYGAGNVIIWDEGWYEPRAVTCDDIRTLRKELKAGHLTFVLHGKKLRGEFALIRMQHAKEENAWLLIKKHDEFASSSKDITKQDESVKSGKRVDELGGRVPNLSSYPKRQAPWVVEPMLCTLVAEPFDGNDWLFEIKWDGYRAIASKFHKMVELYSRNHNDFSEAYPPVVEAVRALEHDVILDGEIVVVDKDGAPHFEDLQNWRRTATGTLAYYVFDILWCDEHDLRKMPLRERKIVLRSVLPKDGLLRYSDDIEGKGVQLFQTMRERHLEGMVAKRAASSYDENVRGSDWLKVKTHLRQEMVIGGYTEPRGGRKYLGSLLVGVYDKGELVYTGHSGGGIPDDARKLLLEKLQRLTRKSSPFSAEPKPNAPVHWTRPELVCEMEFSEWTSEGFMRQPEYKGLRADKNPQDVKREKPRSTAKLTKAKSATLQGNAGQSPTKIAAAIHHPATTSTPKPAAQAAAAKTSSTSSAEPFERTHPDKIFFPKHHYTKGDVFAYYESVADFILPYLKDRPLSLNRMPDGINGEHFFQKNNPHLPPWVPRADIYSDSNAGNLRWIVGGDLETLLYMVQLGAIEINPWNSRVGHLDKPDWIVIDLDPEGVGFDKVIEVARTVKEVCDEWRIPTVPKTSGKTGIHIFIPMGARYTYEQGKNLAHLIALEVNRRQPKVTSVERLPEKRKRRIYLDFLQNREGQTLAAPYSLRPTPDATVSMPLHWDEVRKGLAPSNFTIQNARARLVRVHDLWQPTLGPGLDLTQVLKHIPED